MAEFGLQLSRRLKEQVVCEFEGDGSQSAPVRLVVTVMEIRGNRVKLAFNAPSSVSINRGELVEEGSSRAETFLLTMDKPSQTVEEEPNHRMPALSAG